MSQAIVVNELNLGVFKSALKELPDVLRFSLGFTDLAQKADLIPKVRLVDLLNRELGQTVGRVEGISLFVDNFGFPPLAHTID